MKLKHFTTLEKAKINIVNLLAIDSTYKIQANILFNE